MLMYRPRLQEKYRTEIVPKLQETMGYSNPMEVPKLVAIHLNQGLASLKNHSKLFEVALSHLGQIAGQKPLATKAKKAISNFKLRSGMPVGAKVTLRGKRMYEFLDRLITLALPQVRDFQGIKPHAFDPQGNYTLGIKEQHIFAEIELDNVETIAGLNITLVTSCRARSASYALLEALGMPFAKPTNSKAHV